METRIVGIDLGTTNTVVATASVAGNDAPEIFPLRQFVADGEIAAKSLLPSALFAPLANEAPLAGEEDPFGDAPWIVGEHARRRGERVPSRFVSSAKSWLSHASVDRLAKILPWGDAGRDAERDPDAPRLSPVEASRRILSHVRRAYDAAFPGAELAAQRLVLTVPASFDDVARELTVRAAEEAGLRVRLLEEPVAAFYDYLARTGTAELAPLAEPGDALALVCDVGGGTTDLTLIRVSKQGAALALDRVAVGRHLLLGGDNMDLALAHAAEATLAPPGERLEPILFAELVLACRTAKEQLLSEGAPESVPIRVLYRGSALVGKTLATELTRTAVKSIVLGGFLPDVPRGARLDRPRSGFVAAGLPYERDPAITRHIAAFIERHAPEAGAVKAVLLNGGVFGSAVVRRRVLDAIAGTVGAEVRALTPTDPDLAVARGAVAFGLALDGKGPRIGGGSARGYYVGLASSEGGRRAICVVPRGSKEGERHVVRVPGLTAVVGEPVRFDLFSSDTALDSPGAVVDAAARLEPLPSMTALLGDPDDRGGTRIAVRLEGELTAVGTLDVACVETDDASARDEGRRFRLAFDLRQKGQPSLPPRPRLSDAKALAVHERIERVFGKGHADADPRDARQLLRQLEQILGERATWSTETARRVFDVIGPESRARRRSVDHERAYWQIAGFCLRPGYGHPLDGKRVGKLVPLFSEMVVQPDEARTWQQFWIAWRRVAGGLLEPMQTEIRNLLDPFVTTDEPKPKKKKGLKPQALDEMLVLASSLERVAPERRADLGRWVLERTWNDRDPRLWAAIGRIGARVPTYASAHHVVPPSTVERWLDHLLREKWDDVPSAPLAAVQMARATGDRTRDVSESVRRDVAKRLEKTRAPAEWATAVLDVVPLADTDRAEFFGESLPSGLVLDGDE